MTKRKQCWQSWWHQSMIIRMIIVTAMMKAMEIMMIVITTVLKTIYNMTITVIMSIVMGDDSRWTMMDFDGWMRRMKTTRLHFINIRNHRVLAAFSIVTFSVVVAEFSVFPVRNVVLEKWGFMRVSWNGGTPKSSILYDRIFHYLRTPPNRHWLLDVAQPAGASLLVGQQPALTCCIRSIFMEWWSACDVSPWSSLTSPTLPLHISVRPCISLEWCHFWGAPWN